MASIPDLVKRLADDIQWTTELGNAFLAQQSDVMDAVQRMRRKAMDKGTLTTTEQQKVETQVVEEKTVVVIQQSNPEVVYVPTYNPTVVYGPPVYAYPPVYYPPYTPGAAFFTFSVGVAVVMDAGLYLVVPTVAICYACNAQVRGFPKDRTPASFQIAIHDAYKFDRRHPPRRELAVAGPLANRLRAKGRPPP